MTVAPWDETPGDDEADAMAERGDGHGEYDAQPEESAPEKRSGEGGFDYYLTGPAAGSVPPTPRPVAEIRADLAQRRTMPPAVANDPISRLADDVPALAARAAAYERSEREWQRAANGVEAAKRRVEAERDGLQRQLAEAQKSLSDWQRTSYRIQQERDDARGQLAEAHRSNRELSVSNMAMHHRLTAVEALCDRASECGSGETAELVHDLRAALGSPEPRQDQRRCVDCGHTDVHHAAAEGACLSCGCIGWSPPPRPGAAATAVGTLHAGPDIEDVAYCEHCQSALLEGFTPLRRVGSGEPQPGGKP